MGNSAKRWTEDPREVLRVRAGFDLAQFDRDGKPGFDGKKADGKQFGRERGKLLSELQERLFAHGRTGGERAVLIVVQGLDTAGKGGIARHVMGMVDPQGVAMTAFGVPTAEEAKHHFLWRIKKALPEPGRIGLFDRSHYEDVLVARVDELVSADEIDKRYTEINDFEKSLVESGTVVLKFAMMVSHDEQGLRLMDRLDRPDKRWKFSDSDLRTRAQWYEYQDAYQALFDRTSTDHAPWMVLPADRKWYSRAAVTEVLTQTLIDLDLRYPQPDWDVAEMRARLAESMSVEALAQSLADTEDTVRSAIEDLGAVRTEALKVGNGAGSDAATEAGEFVGQAETRASLAQIKADSAAMVADLARTQEQKALLLERAEETVE